MVDRPSNGLSGPSPAFATIPVTAVGGQGAVFGAGILAISHASGTISACWETCAVIGRIEPSGVHDLVLNSGVYNGHIVWITNVVTGHVTSCEIETEPTKEYDMVGRFKGGSCHDVGNAAK